MKTFLKYILLVILAIIWISLFKYGILSIDSKRDSEDDSIYYELLRITTMN